MTNIATSTPAWVQALDKYVASKPIEELAAELGLKPSEIIMLVANENPYGMSQKVKDKIAHAALNLNRYPDADSCYLQKALSEKYGLPQDWFVITSGSSELLGLTAQTVLSEGKMRLSRSTAFPYIRWLLSSAVQRPERFRQLTTTMPTCWEFLNRSTKILV